MPKGPDYSPMDVGESVVVTIDFGNWLNAGETIISIDSVLVENWHPLRTGPPYLGISGSAQIGTAPLPCGTGVADGAILTKIIGLSQGTGRVVATVETSQGQTFIGWAHQPVADPHLPQGLTL